MDRTDGFPLSFLVPNINANSKMTVQNKDLPV